MKIVDGIVLMGDSERKNLRDRWRNDMRKKRKAARRKDSIAIQKIRRIHA